MINSFVVIVTHSGLTIHHERPAGFDDSYKKYMEYINELFDFERPYHLFTSGGYSDKFFEERARAFSGNINFTMPWVSQIRLTSEQGSYTVELLHKSLT